MNTAGIVLCFLNIAVSVLTSNWPAACGWTCALLWAAAYTYSTKKGRESDA